MTRRGWLPGRSPHLQLFRLPRWALGGVLATLIVLASLVAAAGVVFATSAPEPPHPEPTLCPPKT